MLSALNSGMVAVSLSTLRREFAVDVATVTWVISIFYLTSAVLQPLMGRFADRYGPRRVFATGMVTIMLAGALGPFAPDLAWLCAVRVLLARSRTRSLTTIMEKAVAAIARTRLRRRLRRQPRDRLPHRASAARVRRRRERLPQPRRKHAPRAKTHPVVAATVALFARRRFDGLRLAS